MTPRVGMILDVPVCRHVYSSMSNVDLCRDRSSSANSDPRQLLIPVGNFNCR
jgi:hypothetical protein